MPVAQAVNWTLQACAALAEAHARGVVHRDVKPSNLFRVQRLDGPELIKLLDFGISKMVDDDVQLTRTAAVLGSPLFMSPEQLLNPRGVDRRSDIWSLGVTLYRLLSNKVPFSAPDASSMAAQIAARPPVSLSSITSLPAELCAAVMRCLEKDPEQRWPSVLALADALDSFRDPNGMGSAAQVRLADAQAVASLNAPPPTAQPPPVRMENLTASMDAQRVPLFTLSHDVPRAPVGSSPVAAPVAAPVLAPDDVTTANERGKARRRLALAPAVIAATVFAAAGGLYLASRDPPVRETPPPAIQVVASEPIAIAPVVPREPAEPVRVDAGVVTRVRPTRPQAPGVKDPSDLEIK